MNKNKKASQNLFRLFMFLFIIFLCLYSVSINGYVEKITKRKTLYTESQINRFEQDVNNGTYLDYKNYNLDEEIDYSNKASTLGEKVSDIITYASKKTIDYTNKLVDYLFN